jgi:glycosyltransferase involved in cell wall biosynthesis
MNIIHVSDITRFGGIETLVINLATYQSSSQNMIVSILSPFKKSDNKPIQLSLKINIFYGNLNSGFDFRFKKLIKIIKIFKNSDLIHFHGFNIFLILCAKIAKRKLIYTEHGTFQKENQKKSFRKFINKRILGYFVLKHFVSKVVFNSNWLKENVALKSNNVAVILNGTILKLKGSTKLDCIKDTFKVLTVARIVRKKRLDRLIRAFSNLKYNNKYFLDIVGDGPCLDELKKLAKDILKENTYKFHGYQSDVTEFYLNTDIFVLSTENEAFGMVVLEAMLAKKPVICFADGGGALEVIDSIHPRLIVKDEGDLSEAIEYWRINEDKKNYIGEKLFERAKSIFSLERMANEYLWIYNEVLER